MNTVIQWQDIEIEITYIRSYSTSYEEIYGHPLAHVEIRAAERLPMTKTGYRSHFAPAQVFEEYGGPVAFVQAWLAEAEQAKDWQAYLADRQQLTLF